MMRYEELMIDHETIRCKCMLFSITMQGHSGVMTFIEAMESMSWVLYIF